MGNLGRNRGLGMLKRWLPCLVLFFMVSNAQAEWVSIVPPDVSADWGLSKGRILPSGDGWAVGNDYVNKKGVLIRYKEDLWTVINPPHVSSNWELNGLGFTAVNDVWAVGTDYSTGSRKGVLLHYLNGLWYVVTPPFVSLDWGLYDASFTASNQGWAVGVDYANKRGVLLKYNNNIWTSYIPPDVSVDWGLYGMHMVNANEGWAVGVDNTNKRGVLLHYAKDPDDKNRRKRYIWQVFLPPRIDADWGLTGVFAPSTTEAWAVGMNNTQKKGVMLRFYGLRWDEVVPPEVSSDWGFNYATFPSTYKGWVSGFDFENQKGVLLQYDRGYNKDTWTYHTLPGISSDWSIGNVRFANADNIWAFGTDHENKKGVILRFNSNTRETVSTPSKPNGPTHFSPDTPSMFYTGESLSNLDHSVQYLIDWGDGTDSGWLPVGVVGASKSWSAPGTYPVKARARCDTDTDVVSKFSSTFSVTVSDSPTPITLLSPADGTPYDSCSLYSLPTFSWEADGTFTGYQIEFSETESFDTTAASDKTTSTSMVMDDTVWKRVIAAFGTNASGGMFVIPGGPLFWRVIGTRADKTGVVSDTRAIILEPLQPVGNPAIDNTSKNSVPILSWNTNCNIKFRVWFGNNAFFSKKTSLTFNIKDPGAKGGVFTESLTSSQWTTVQNLTGRIAGSTIYWYVESWDGVNRRTVSQPSGFFVVTE